MHRGGHDNSNDLAQVTARPGSFSWGWSRHQGSSYRLRWVGGRTGDMRRRTGKAVQGSRLLQGVEGVCK